VFYAGGGGGTSGSAHLNGAPGGVGGGGRGAVPGSAIAGTVNTGGGAGGVPFSYVGPPTNNPTSGGSGIVVVRAPSTAKFTVSPGTNTVTTAPNGDKIGTFTVSGNLTI
jgi:hypothetical protein